MRRTRVRGWPRTEAEKTLAISPEKSTWNGKTPEEIIYELSVHQIELEIQNEELKKIQHELEESRDRFIDLYDFAPSGYFTLTEEALISQVNLSGAALLGVVRKKLINTRFRKFVSPDTHGIWDRFILSVLNHEAKETCTIRLIRSNGTVIHTRIEGVRVKMSDESHLARLAITDISELKEAEDALRESELVIRSALAEKEVLLREVHHRVKNNLATIISLINLQVVSLSSDSEVSHFQDLEGRVRSMALVHETLYQADNLSQVPISSYLESLVRYLTQIYQGREEIKFRFSIDPILLSLDTAFPCGMVTNEIITNALKYAFPPGFSGESERGSPCMISIDMKIQGTDYLLSISDNGIGMPDNTSDVKQTIGLVLIQFIISHQLRGSVQITTNRGTQYVIRFPKLRNDGGNNV